jgi:hypothetical protein
LHTDVGWELGDVNHGCVLTDQLGE